MAAAVLAVVAFFVIRRYRRSRNRTAAERSAKARRVPKKPAARGGHPANGTNAAPFLDSPRKSESSTGGSGTSGSPIMKKPALPGEPGQGDCSTGATSPCISSLCLVLSMMVTCSFCSLCPGFCSQAHRKGTGLSCHIHTCLDDKHQLLPAADGVANGHAAGQRTQPGTPSTPGTPFAPEMVPDGADRPAGVMPLSLQAGAPGPPTRLPADTPATGLPGRTSAQEVPPLTGGNNGTVPAAKARAARQQAQQAQQPKQAGFARLLPGIAQQRGGASKGFAPRGAAGKGAGPAQGAAGPALGAAGAAASASRLAAGSPGASAGPVGPAGPAAAAPPAATAAPPAPAARPTAPPPAPAARPTAAPPAPAARPAAAQSTPATGAPAPAQPAASALTPNPLPSAASAGGPPSAAGTEVAAGAGVAAAAAAAAAVAAATSAAQQRSKAGQPPLTDPRAEAAPAQDGSPGSFWAAKVKAAAAQYQQQRQQRASQRKGQQQPADRIGVLAASTPGAPAAQTLGHAEIQRVAQAEFDRALDRDVRDVPAVDMPPSKLAAAQSSSGAGPAGLDAEEQDVLTGSDLQRLAQIQVCVGHLHRMSCCGLDSSGSCSQRASALSCFGQHDRPGIMHAGLVAAVHCLGGGGGGLRCMPLLSPTLLYGSPCFQVSTPCNCGEKDAGQA